MSNTPSSNIILIGMPGSGKSTIGAQLAKHLNLHFVDTDLLIEADQGVILQEVSNNNTHQGFLDIEERVLLQIDCNQHVISTGGSVIYSDAIMQHLKIQGVVVYLNVGFDEIQKRITSSENSRGISKPAGQTLEDIYNERQPLYCQYADITFNNEQTPDIPALATEIQSFTDK